MKSHIIDRAMTTYRAFAGRVLRLAEDRVEVVVGLHYLFLFALVLYVLAVMASQQPPVGVNFFGPGGLR